jgi:UDP-glucose:(heptosyl)LPS alpha-1,3-glucosyltransferase
MGAKPRIAVVSPFLDKQHGTERCVVEQLDRLGEHYEIHIYSMRVEDLDQNKFVWHRIPKLPGPHLLAYIWWFGANHFWRWRDRRFRKIDYDLIYSPGINCLDADVIAVHIVFHEFYRLVHDELRLRRLPLRDWPRAIHRRLYYHVIMALEKRIYPDPRVALAAVSHLTAQELEHFFARRDVWVIPNAVDLDTFNPEARWSRRDEARRRLQFDDQDFVLLLIGNDWKKKGVDTLLEAAARCSDLPVHVLIVGRDDRAPYERASRRLGLQTRVRFAEPSKDVVQFYAAADAYVGPSLHDSFALPPAEAMACAVPVVTSIQNGGSEMITDGVNGLLLRDPKDPAELSNRIRRLYENPDLRKKMGENAARTAEQLTWERNAASTDALFQEALRHRDA